MSLSKDAVNFNSEVFRTDSLSKLQQIVRNISADRLKKQCMNDFEVSEVKNSNASILGHWLSVILISGRKIKISFKIHYMSSDALVLLSMKTSKAIDQLRIHMAFDFLKEYCNLTAGGVKECLGEENSVTGLSLPLLTRGFDEVLFMDRLQHGNHRQKLRDVWRVGDQNVSIICSSEVQITDWSALENLVEPSQKHASHGDLEFL